MNRITREYVLNQLIMLVLFPWPLGVPSLHSMTGWLAKSKEFPEAHFKSRPAAQQPMAVQHHRLRCWTAGTLAQRHPQLQEAAGRRCGRHSAPPVLQSDDEEALAEEEAEALRLQREQAALLAPDDYHDAHLFPEAQQDGGGDDTSGDDGGEEPTLGEAAAAQV